MQMCVWEPPSDYNSLDVGEGQGGVVKWKLGGVGTRAGGGLGGGAGGGGGGGYIWINFLNILQQF